jgi:NAD(P)-dependent dehydrogenase (short-subunit alcohol dehydrogenase family)
MIEHSTAPDAGDLSGRTALVTGGGSGIGRAIALALASRGMDVLVVGRRPAAISQTAALCSGIRHLVADVAEPKDTPRVVHAAAAELGRLDILVNNAAILRPAPLEKIELVSAREVWETNVLGPTLLAQAALPHLVASRGAIVNVSSTFGTKPAPQISQYGASKAALEQLTISWALELADRGVRVNAVAPGPTQSEAEPLRVVLRADRAGESRRAATDPARASRRARRRGVLGSHAGRPGGKLGDRPDHRR